MNCYINFKPTENAFSKRTYLVTGASQGIGYALALAIAQFGGELILLARNENKLNQLYDQILATEAPTPLIIPLDLAKLDTEEAETLARHIEAQCGQLNGLIHNASILGKLTPLDQYPIPLWEQVLKVNTTSCFTLTQALTPLMQKSKPTSVIFSSSSVGREPRAYWGAYSISKCATEALMQIWANEWANTSHIRVNSINPGGTRTQMRRQAYPAENPLSCPKPEAILGTYLYLLADESEHISGKQFSAQPSQSK